MKVTVDPDLCIGCEACVEVCPECFEMAGDVAVAKSGSITTDLQALAREAADSCPVDAIIVEE